MSFMRDVIGDYSWKEQSVAFVANTPTLVIPADPDRWMFAVAGQGIAFSLSTLTTPAVGFILPGFPVAGSETKVISYRDWGAFVNQQWYAQTSAGPGTFTLFTLSKRT